MEENKDMTVHEALNELRKGLRLFKAFEKIERISESWAGMESHSVTVSQAIEAKTKELEELVKGIAEANQILVETQSSISKAKEDAARKAEVDLAVNKRQVEVLREEAAVLQDDIKGLELTKLQVTDDVAVAKAELAEVQESIAKAKEDFAKRANSI